LVRLRQGTRSVQAYTREFKEIAANLDWNDNALRDVYYKGLQEEVKDLLVYEPLPKDFGGLIKVAIRCGELVKQNKNEEGTYRIQNYDQAESMNLDLSQRSHQECFTKNEVEKEYIGSICSLGLSKNIMGPEEAVHPLARNIIEDVRENQEREAIEMKKNYVSRGKVVDRYDNQALVFKAGEKAWLIRKNIRQKRTFKKFSNAKYYSKKNEETAQPVELKGVAKETLDYFYRNGKFRYLVKWKGYPNAEDLHEPPINMTPYGEWIGALLKNTLRY
jgi:Retrotransposon gag protein